MSNDSNQYNQGANICAETERPEVLLAQAFKTDLGVTIDPQALRIFLRWRWDRVQKLAHKIHDTGPC